MNKKGLGMGMGSGRKTFSIILGLIFLALGGIPLLNALNVIGFSLPTVPMIVFWALALLGALFLIIDGFKEEAGFGSGGSKMIGIISIVLALVLIAFGLGSFGVLPFALPDVSMLIINILFTLAGLLLVVGGLKRGI